MSAAKRVSFDQILVVGAGKMGGALVDGWLAQGIAGSTIRLIDPTLDADDRGWGGKGVGCFASLEAMRASAPGELPSLILLAIKPQMMGAILPSLGRLDHADLTVLSIAAGTPIAVLQSAFPSAVCVRSMPNTPAAVGAGVTGVFGPRADAHTRDGLTALLGAVGKVVWVDDERLIDAVTAISGSGPAYMFHMVEALALAGEKLGLAPDTAMVLARQTLIGAGALLDASEESAGVLRQNVTSPGGTTAAGLAVLRDSGKLAALMEQTAKSAYDRSLALASSEPVTKT